MLIESNYNLNLVQRCDHSLQEILKRKILDQEEIFRKQVLELHCLYQRQRMLMRDLDMRGLVLGRSSTQPMWCPFSESLKFELMAVGTSSSGVSMADRLQSMKGNLLPEHTGFYRELQPGLLDLEVPACHYIDDFSNDLGDNKWSGSDTLEESVRYKHDSFGETTSCLEELELSLRINRENLQNGTVKTLDEKFTSSCHVIDLQGSSKRVSDEDFNSMHNTSFYVPGTDSVTDPDLFLSCIIGTSEKKDMFHSIRGGRPLEGGSPSCAQEKPFNQGANQYHGTLSGVDNIRRRLFSSCEAGELDLNKTQPDESSFYSTEHEILNPLKCTSLGVSHGMVGEFHEVSSLTAADSRDPNGSSSNESSTLLHPDHIKSNSTAFNHQDNSGFPAPSTLCSVSAKSNRERLLDKGDPGSYKNSRPRNANLPESLSDETEPIEGMGSNKSPPSCKSDSLTEDISSKTSKEETEEVDIQVKKGAISLIYFALECLAEDQSCAPQGSKRSKPANDKGRPQCSSDSYELMVLKQPESNLDDYCVTSNPVQVNCVDEKDYGVKLRRGRRMKDFQKDILPTLASLSRHEIYEDIKIMEGAMRSREYKKLQSKMVTRSLCFAPVRSKRSRLNYVGRKYFS